MHICGLKLLPQITPITTQRKMINELFTKNRISKTKYIALPNAEEPRIILPIANRKVFKKGFEIHNTSSPLNRLFKNLSTNFSYLLPYFHSKILYPTQKLYELLEAIKQNINQNEISSISVYVGTKNSANQKLTFQLMDNHYNIIGYVKLADNNLSTSYIKNEFEVFSKIKKYTLVKLIYPQKQKIFSFNKYTLLFLENIFKDSIYVCYEINELLFNASLEIAEKTKTYGNLQEFYGVKKVEMKRLPLEHKLIEWIIKNIEILRENNIPIVFIHGDYVPYNMKVRNDKLALIDWEYSSESGLPLFDLFTFIYQGGYQIFNKRIKRLVDEILDKPGKNYSYFKKYLEKLNINEEMIGPLFIIYLTESLLLHLIRRSDANIKNNQFYLGLSYLLKNKR